MKYNIINIIMTIGVVIFQYIIIAEYAIETGILAFSGVTLLGLILYGILAYFGEDEDFFTGAIITGLLALFINLFYVLIVFLPGLRANMDIKMVTGETTAIIRDVMILEDKADYLVVEYKKPECNCIERATCSINGKVVYRTGDKIKVKLIEEENRVVSAKLTEDISLLDTISEKINPEIVKE